jgi:hypothetical protein
MEQLRIALAAARAAKNTAKDSAAYQTAYWQEQEALAAMLALQQKTLQYQ